MCCEIDRKTRITFNGKTLFDLSMESKRVFPSVLVGVESNKYRHKDYSEYLLLDDVDKDGNIPTFFYNGSWREGRICQDITNIVNKDILEKLSLY